MSETVVEQSVVYPETLTSPEKVRFVATVAGSVFVLLGIDFCGLVSVRPVAAEVSGGMAVASGLVAAVAHASALRQQGSRE